MKKAIQDRNDIAHGGRFLHGAQYGRIPVGTVELIRIRPMREEGVIKTVLLTGDEIDEWSDKLARLRIGVCEYGNVCLGLRGYESVTVRELLAIHGGEVVPLQPPQPSPPSE